MVSYLFIQVWIRWKITRNPFDTPLIPNHPLISFIITSRNYFNILYIYRLTYISYWVMQWYSDQLLKEAAILNIASPDTRQCLKPSFKPFTSPWIHPYYNQPPLFRIHSQYVFLGRTHIGLILEFMIWRGIRSVGVYHWKVYCICKSKFKIIMLWNFWFVI